MKCLVHCIQLQHTYYTTLFVCTNFYRSYICINFTNKKVNYSNNFQNNRFLKEGKKTYDGNIESQFYFYVLYKISGIEF